MEFKRRAMLLDYGDKALAEAFYNTLKEEIKDEISQIEKQLIILLEMKKHAIQIDNQIYKRRIEKKKYQYYLANTSQRREKK
jgi:hypothetical protein